MAQAYQERVVHGVIRSSLYAALAAQGEVAKIATDLADILAWEIDFAKEVRTGDAFRILIQEALQDGPGVAYHRILAAEMVTQSRVSRVVYYAPEGDQGPTITWRAGRSAAGFSARRCAIRVFPRLFLGVAGTPS
jgi:hypothetical protein